MFYTRLRDLREDNDLSQKDLAAYLNCSQVAYSYYEIGRRNLPIETLIRLAKYYECSTDYLLGLTDVKKPYPSSVRIDRIPVSELSKTSSRKSTVSH